MGYVLDGVLVSISIHAPRTGSDGKQRHHGRCRTVFQSTLPARGATSSNRALQTMRHFNPRSPHGERPRPPIALCRPCVISIHAPRTGSDAVSEMVRVLTGDFNPRSPHGERLLRIRFMCLEGGISIHAPRTGSDCQTGSGHDQFLTDFNPRSPHGERLPTHPKKRRSMPFQSTLPARGATWVRRLWLQEARYFNPRSPHGERLQSSGARRGR